MISRGAAGGVTRAGSINRLTKPAGSRPSRGKLHALWLSFVLLVASGIFVLATPTAAQAATLSAGFSESVVFSGLTNPTVVRFANDGRVFVAEKRGVIKVFDSLTDTTPDVVRRSQCQRPQLLGSRPPRHGTAPNFPTDPFVYVLYTYDHELGSAAPAPRWGTPGVYSDPCPTPPGATGDGCVVSGRLSRLQASGNTMTGSEQVLIEDWCQQYPSHSVGTVEFGRDGALYASGAMEQASTSLTGAKMGRR